MIYTITLNPSIDYIMHVDKFSEGQLNRSTNEYHNIGGKGIMVSKLLSNVGIDNTSLGFLGGFTGNHILNWFKENDLKENFTKVKGNTRINIKLKSSVESEINGAGPNISKDEENDFLEKLNALEENDIIIISGSIASGLSKDIFSKIINKAVSKNADFVIDTTGEALLNALTKKPLLIKPNLDELQELFGVKLNSIEEIIPYGKKCIDLGAKYVIISMGSNGALFFTKDNTYYSPSIKGNLVNSVGAGDSMLGGFVGYLKEGHTDLDSFKYSVACGTATAFCKDIATKDKINELLTYVEIINY